MLEIQDPSKQYPLNHPSGAVFILAHWTVAMQEIVDKECIVQDGVGGYKYLLSREREIKIQSCVKDWSGVSFSGTDFPCTPENKKMLPVGVMIWIIKDIDERAGLRMSTEEKKT